MDNRMRQFGYLLSSRLAQALYGRNGFDNLARTSYFTAFILMIINMFADSLVIYLIWVALLVYATFRILSKNISKRYAENEKFMSATKVPRSYLNLAKLQIRDRETSRYYICKKCHQQIRVPKGKGRIEIRCPKCGERFIKKT